MTRRHDFATRLTIARTLIARGAPPPAAHIADQLTAASRDTRAAHDRLGVVLPLLQPDRHWRHRVDGDTSDEVRAVLFAAVLDCLTVCCHLKRVGPQPVFIQLPLRRSDCARCVRTLRRPPADDSDRCDVCGMREVIIFHPFAVRMGPSLISGDACSACADVLGIVQEVSA